MSGVGLPSTSQTSDTTAPESASTDAGLCLNIGPSEMEGKGRDMGDHKSMMQIESCSPSGLINYPGKPIRVAELFEIICKKTKESSSNVWLVRHLKALQ